MGACRAEADFRGLRIHCDGQPGPSGNVQVSHSIHATPSEAGTALPPLAPASVCSSTCLGICKKGRSKARTWHPRHTQGHSWNQNAVSGQVGMWCPGRLRDSGQAGWATASCPALSWLSHLHRHCFPIFIPSLARWTWASCCPTLCLCVPLCGVGVIVCNGSPSKQ